MTRQAVMQARRGDVLVITIEAPLTQGAVRADLMNALRHVTADDSLRAVVLAGKGRCFANGLDLSDTTEPQMGALCTQAENMRKPVVMALHGVTTGAGLELAMAAHVRVAGQRASFGFPEITLGLIPNSGGTQRAPRLIGAGPALDMMLSGISVSAKDAAELGLVDLVTAADDITLAALDSITDRTKPRPTSLERRHLTDGARYMAEVNERRDGATVARGRELMADKLINCVEAALLVPFDSGLAMEQRAFEDCFESRASKGLRHIHDAELLAARFPELGRVEPRQVRTVGLYGAERCGVAFAVACLNAGMPITVVEAASGISSALDRIGSYYETAVAQGVMEEEKATTALSYLTLSTRLEDLSEADFILEDTPDEEERKGEAVARLGQIASAGAILASSTTYLSLDMLAEASGRPEDMVGMMFSLTDPALRLVEVVAGPLTSETAVLTARAVARGLGRVPVRASGARGFLSTRLLMRLRQVADALLEDGVQPQQIDTVLRNQGWPMGLYELEDQIGLDVAWARRRQLGASGRRHVELADKMCLAGWFGVSTGKGFYLYDGLGQRGSQNPEMLALLLVERTAKALRVRAFSDAAIAEQLRLALVNEAAWMLQEGAVARASDLDVVMVHGFGYPRSTGGPLFEADEDTTFKTTRRIEALSQSDPLQWRVAPLLIRLARERARFSDLNGNELN